MSAQAKRDGQWGRLDQLTLEANTCVEIYLERVDFPLLLLKQVFVNEDGSTGISVFGVQRCDPLRRPDDRSLSQTMERGTLS